jgi:hypothetical protein
MVKFFDANELGYFRISNEEEGRSEVEKPDNSRRIKFSPKFSRSNRKRILLCRELSVPFLHKLRHRKLPHQKILPGSKEHDRFSICQPSVLEITEFLCGPFMNQETDNDQQHENYPQHFRSTAFSQLNVNFSLFMPNEHVETRAELYQRITITLH